MEVSGDRLKREGWEAKDCLRLVCLDEKGSLPPITAERWFSKKKFIMSKA